MATETQTPTCAKAITLPCPCCGAEEAGIDLRLDQLDDDDAQFYCRECEAEFGRNLIETFVSKWTRVLAWMDAAPDVNAGP